VQIILESAPVFNKPAVLVSAFRDNFSRGLLSLERASDQTGSVSDLINVSSKQVE
jgi:hypothetical protein